MNQPHRVDASVAYPVPVKRGACPRCRIPRRWCFCHLLVPLRVRTPVHVLMHFRELRKSTNTGYYLPFVHPGARIHLRGLPATSPDFESMTPPAYTPLCLFPDDDAHVLTADLVASLPHPPSLIVPDGSWNQARRMRKREEALQRIPAVCLPPGTPSRWRLRKAPAPDALCTFEAVARALGVIEGPFAERAMMGFFDEMVRHWREARRRGPRRAHES